MKGLAWDDKREYFDLLAKSLGKMGIGLEIVASEEMFVDRFLSEEIWDFIVTDLVHDDFPVKGESENVGLRIARRVSNSEKGRNLPIFVVTQHYERLGAKDVDLSPEVVIKSKSTYTGWLAGEMRQELRRRGLFVDKRKVFLIYGHDREARGARGRIEHFLAGKGIEVVKLGDGALKVEIAQGLLNKMNQCGAVIAICTPDDNANVQHQPRPNVFVEIGLALGLSRGLQRLVILQKWGPTSEQQAMLPSDLGGILTIRFEGEIDQYLEELALHLRQIGIVI